MDLGFQYATAASNPGFMSLRRAQSGLAAVLVMLP
jgi:hypothetical protein